jgi:D-alanyl-D-alanine carboxypeptidase
MIYRSRPKNSKKIFLTIPLFIVFIFLAVSLSHGAENLPAPKVLKGYINQKEQKDFYTNIKRIGDAEPAWEPLTGTSAENSDLIAGFSGLIVDIDNDKTLFSKNAKTKVKIASLVKVMTAVVALEHGDPDQEIVISSKAATIGENSMGISEGEVYTLRELLYGLFLASGNDSAYAIAEGIAGDSDTFVEWMNIKAKELGMTDTVFYDPSGLDDRTISTAYDLVRLSRYALKSMEIRKIAKTEEMILTAENHKDILLSNQTNLLTTYPGVEGLKTGYTEDAGLCLITYARNYNHEFVGVVLNSIDRQGHMILMLDYAFAVYGIKIDHNLL